MHRICRRYGQALVALCAVFAFAGSASAQVNLTAPNVPVLVGSNISMAGTGYPAGTINAGSVSITVTPSAGNGSPVSFAPITVSGTGSNRTLIFKLPVALSANQPYTATVAVAGQTTANTTFTTPKPPTITINPAASISNVSPGAGQTSTAVNVMITGLYSHFAQATSVVTVGGTGVTVSNMAVTPGSTTQLTATFTIAANATIGPRTVTVTNGSEVATLAVGFVVTSTPGLSFSVINPNFAPQGTSRSVDVQGINTHFKQGTTTANFGDGITITSIQVNSLTDMTVGLTIDPLARTGGRIVTVVTGGEFAMASNGFTVTSSGASIISATPVTPVAQGANATLTLTGNGTYWVTSGTVVSFGGGINTGNVTINSNTSLTVNISVGPGVAPGVYGVTTTTNGEVAMLANAVTVTAATPFISGVAPGAAAQGATLDVIVTGTYTNFNLGTPTANFGPHITVNNITPLSATSVDINISIDFVAAAGLRSVTLTSNGTLFSFNFSVTPSSASITSVTPNSGPQESSVALQITGSNTHWVQGTTMASLGDPNITINRVVVNSFVSAEVDITIGAQAGLGLHGLSMTTGGEVVSYAGAFTVLPFTPSLSLAPSSGMIGTTVTVNFNGNFTHFVNGVTTANINGQGIQTPLQLTVTGPTTATAQFVISPTAPSSPAYPCSPTPNRTVTVTTVNEIVTAPFCVTSTPAMLTNITPYQSPRNNTLTVTITGQYTNFTNAGPNPTTVGFGPDITVNSLNILSATSLTANISIDSAAAFGWRQAYVNTGSEQLSIGFVISSSSLLSVSPNTGQQGQTINNVTITGNVTNFVQGSSIAILGAGITVSNLTILSPTVATATITISPTTYAGPRTVEMITGVEDVAGPLFNVTAGVASITFTPNCLTLAALAVVCNSGSATVQQGGIVPFSLTGNSTHFVQGETTLNFGAGISVTQLTVNSPTSITGQIVVSYTAPIGFHQPIATTDGEMAVAASDAVVVVQTTPSSLNITPASGQQGAMHLMIQLNGSLTNWVNGTTVATLLDGNHYPLTVNAVNVTSPTQAILDLTIPGTAYLTFPYPGVFDYYSLTVTTNHGGGNIEQELLSNVFTVNPGAAIIISVAPPSGVQGTTENVTITGQNTNWLNGVTTAYFTTGGCVLNPNPGVNVANVTVASPTSAMLSVAISPTAQTGLQTLCLVTIGELVNFQNSFTIIPGTPTLNSVTPVSAEQGATTTLSLTGQFTSWQQGVTTVTFGQGITLLSPLSVNTATSATASISVDPLAYTGGRNVVVNTNGQIVQGTFFSVTPGPAILSSISPSTGNQGTHILMQLNGQNTHWAQELSQVTINGAGYDITINGVQVQSPTTAVVDLNLSPTAALGARTVYISTGGENLSLYNGFVVTGGIPAISGISPYSIQQGSSNVNVQISGIFTTWDSTTQVSFGPNIPQPTWTVNNNKSITAVISVPIGALLGLQTVTVQTGGQILTASVNIIGIPTPYISYEYPSVALTGQTLSVSFVGQYTNWLPGTTQITFGAGITVNSFQVTGLNTAIANITIIPTATLGPRTVIFTTGAETETTTFTIATGTPAITLLSPGSVIQGQTEDVDIVGQYTTFGSGTIFNFGPGITINLVMIFGSTAARVNISASLEAPQGAVTVTETSGTEVASNSGAPFSVSPSQAAITMVSPNTAPQGTSPVINVTGFATHWTGATVFNLNGISVTQTTINSATSATLTLSVTALATVGEYSISATTGGEVATLNNAFVVTAGTPILVSATGSPVQQGMTFSVGILGQSTSFVNSVTSVNLGAGVNVTGVNVTSGNSITVTGNVDPLAYTGNRNVTVSTGTQTLVLFNAFVVTPGTAAISQLNPAQGNQGQTLNVAITGTNTHFSQTMTTASFGQGITVNSLTVNSFLSATANITIAVNAVAQLNSVTLTTLGESATAANAFTVVASSPVIDFINPTFLSQGQTGNITVTASFTNFVTGNTTANFGAGVTVNSTTVNSPTSATVNITVSPIATTGSRSVQLTTNLGGGNQQLATLANAFTINPGPATILSATPTSPATVHQNDTGDTIVITGNSSHFSAASTVVFCTGVTPVQTNFNSATQLTVVVNISVNAPLGGCGVTVTTGAEVASGSNLFSVLAGLPVVTGVNPPSARENTSNLNVAITGLYTNFAPNTVTTYNLTAAEDANSANSNPDGVWSFLAGTSVLPYSNGFCDHSITGLSFDYSLNTGCSAAFFVARGAGRSPGPVFLANDIVVYSPDGGSGANNPAFVNWTAPAAGTITISGEIWYADLVARSNDYILALNGTTLATGSAAYGDGSSRANPHTFSGGGILSVNAGDVVSLEIRESAGQVYGSFNGIDLSVTESFSAPQNGTVASFGPDITVNSLNVNNTNSATANITVPLTAALGSRTVTMTTGGEIATLANAFTVIPALLSITTATLPNGTTGVNYQQTVAVFGGLGPFNFSITSGSPPTILTLNPSSGLISGTPAGPGISNLTIQVTDNSGQTAAMSYTLNVYNPLLLSPSSLPAGVSSVAYSQMVTASGGAAPLTLSLHSGALPGNVTFNPATGSIGGTPTLSGTFTVDIRVTDNNGSFADQSYSFTIYGPLQFTTTSPLPDGHLTLPYSQTIAYTGGVPAVTLSVVGTLPGGLSLTGAIIGGTPNATGPFSFQLKMTDANGNTALQGYSLTVDPAISITTTSPLPGGIVGVAYSQTIATANGVAPVAFGISAGTLPTSLSLNPTTGNIFGTPTVAGTYNFTVQATDNLNLIAAVPFSVTIVPPPTITLVSPNQLQAGQSYSVSLTGQNTNWVNGTTTASFGAGVTVTSVTVSSATSATAAVSVSVAASGGTRDVTLTTGTEVATLTGGVTILASAPTFTLLSPASAKANTTASVTVTGMSMLGATFQFQNPIPGLTNVPGPVSIVSNNGTTALLSFPAGGMEGQYTLVAATSLGSSPANTASQFIVLHGGTYTMNSPALSILNVAPPITHGESNSPLVSILNVAPPITHGESNSPLVSILNVAPPTGSTGHGESNSALVSILNAIVPTFARGMNVAGSPTVAVCNVASGCTAQVPQTLSLPSPSRSLSTVTSVAPTVLDPHLEPVESLNSIVVGRSILLAAEWVRPSDLAKVDFEVNGTVIGSVGQAPYTLLFTVPAGVSELVFRAIVQLPSGAAASSLLVRMPVESDSVTAVKLPAMVAGEDRGVTATLFGGGLKAEYFAFPQPLTATPALDGLTPQRTGFVTAVNQPNPAAIFGDDPLGAGLSKDFAVRFSGDLWAEGGGDYNFWLGARSGAQLRIDGKPVAVTDATMNTPAEAAATVTLAPGWHKIEIVYFLAVGAESVRLEWQQPGAWREVISPQYLRTPLSGVTADSVPAIFDSVWIRLQQAGGSRETLLRSRQ